LIGRYGPVGAAVAVLVAEGVLVVMTVIATRRMLDLTFLASRMVISALASLAFLLPAMLWPRVPMFGVIIAATVIYVAVVLSFPTIRRHELPAIAAMRGQRGRPPVDSPVTD
jgi:O-antigen/teichoic acid export membrane protein